MNKYAFTEKKGKKIQEEDTLVTFSLRIQMSLHRYSDFFNLCNGESLCKNGRMLR